MLNSWKHWKRSGDAWRDQVCHYEVGPGTSDLWSSCNRMAASPLGSIVQPCCKSLTDEGESPTLAPISAKVIPFRRRSFMRVDHVDIAPKSTAARYGSQRLSAMAFAHNGFMARPAELPKLDTIGARVRWWREHRKISRHDLAKRTKQSYSTLADLENERSNNSERLDLIAMELGLSPSYLRTDKGDPEASAVLLEPSVQWPAGIGSQLSDLDEIELAYFEAQAKQTLLVIQNARERRRKKQG